MLSVSGSCMRCYNCPQKYFHDDEIRAAKMRATAMRVVIKEDREEGLTESRLKQLSTWVTQEMIMRRHTNVGHTMLTKDSHLGGCRS